MVHITPSQMLTRQRCPPLLWSTGGTLYRCRAEQGDGTLGGDNEEAGFNIIPPSSNQPTNPTTPAANALPSFSISSTFGLQSGQSKNLSAVVWTNQSLCVTFLFKLPLFLDCFHWWLISLVERETCFIETLLNIDNEIPKSPSWSARPLCKLRNTESGSSWPLPAKTFYSLYWSPLTSLPIRLAHNFNSFYSHSTNFI